MRSTSLLTAITLSLAAAPVSALPLNDEPNRVNVPKEQWLSPSQISEILSENGYKVTDIEIDDGGYEVELIDKNGMRIEGHVYVYPATGGLLGHDDWHASSSGRPGIFEREEPRL
jgi:hypothetical protein